MAAGPEILIPIFAITFGIPFVVAPLVKSLSKRLESGAQKPDAELMERLSSIERNIDVIAIEIEKLSESQRFVTKLYAERERTPGALPPGAP
jgi:hypothetical protein